MLFSEVGHSRSSITHRNNDFGGKFVCYIQPMNNPTAQVLHYKVMQQMNEGSTFLCQGARSSRTRFSLNKLPLSYLASGTIREFEGLLEGV